MLDYVRTVWEKACGNVDKATIYDDALVNF